MVIILKCDRYDPAFIRCFYSQLYYLFRIFILFFSDTINSIYLFAIFFSPLLSTALSTLISHFIKLQLSALFYRVRKIFLIDPIELLLARLEVLTLSRFEL